MGYKITIDGPAGSGKGFLADAISKTLNILNIDTGAMYRAFGLYCIENNVDIEDEASIKKALDNTKISFTFSNNLPKIYLNGEDVSCKIRTEQLGLFSAKVSSILMVRKFMASLQRQIAGSNNVVVEGRDMGSVVFPDAELKIFLTADILTRTERRLKDLLEKKKKTSFDEVLEIIKKRDEVDYNKKISPLIKTEDMIEIDTTNMEKQQVIDTVINLAIKKGLVDSENI